MTWLEAYFWALREVPVQREVWDPGKWVFGDKGIGAVTAVIMIRDLTGEIRVAEEADIGADGYRANDWRFVATGVTERLISGFTWSATGVFDDDACLRAVMADGSERVLSDTQWNLSWYNGEVFVPEPRTGYLTTHRVISVSRAAALVAGVELVSGLQVNVYGVDAWAANWAIAPWTVEIRFSDGGLAGADGGWSETGVGTSVVQRPVGISDADYFLHSGPYGPVEYRAAGVFQLP
jgi:hypothetical protein